MTEGLFIWEEVISVKSTSQRPHPVYEVTFPHINRTKLFDLAKCFLANRDNVYLYEPVLIIV